MPYSREREQLTAVESQYFGGLVHGDCLPGHPSQDLSHGAAIIDCSQPHIYQVAGFVDLSEGMPDKSDGINFEISVVQRCSSLKAVLRTAPAFTHLIALNYTTDQAWNDDVRVALCWVAMNVERTGSVLDGSFAPA